MKILSEIQADVQSCIDILEMDMFSGGDLNILQNGIKSVAQDVLDISEHICSLDDRVILIEEQIK